MLRLALLAAFAATPDEAFAHAAPQGAGALAFGLLHPFLVSAHVLNLVGLGLLIGQSERGRASAVAIFSAALLCGLAATARSYVSPTTLLLPLSAGVIGILVAVAWRLPAALPAAIAAVAGVMLGLDSRPETPFLRDAILMFAGTTLAAGAAVALIATGVSFLRSGWLRIGTRILGSWIAAAAILVSALQFAR